MGQSPATGGRWREAALVALVLAPLAVLVAAVPPIPQDPAYHRLADARTFFGIPNFLNVASSASFLLVGALGLAHSLRAGVAGAAHSWMFFFAGTLMVGFGSAYYHLAPDSSTLAWDRLPMTLAFASLVSAVIAEHLRLSYERVLLPLAIAAGLASVGWWVYTDDLRFYAWVQFAPFAALLLALLLYPGRYSHRSLFGWGLACYGLAKVFEFSDQALYAATAGTVSGHTLKHLMAAAAAFCVYLMLVRRSPVTPE